MLFMSLSSLQITVRSTDENLNHAVEDASLGSHADYFVFTMRRLQIGNRLATAAVLPGGISRRGRFLNFTQGSNACARLGWPEN